jgi:hypothetical protein
MSSISRQRPPQLDRAVGDLVIKGEYKDHGIKQDRIQR